MAQRKEKHQTLETRNTCQKDKFTVYFGVLMGFVDNNRNIKNHKIYPSVICLLCANPINQDYFSIMLIISFAGSVKKSQAFPNYPPPLCKRA